jgi:hypothetical protein
MSTTFEKRNELKILSLKCCRLKKGVNYPEFKDLIKRHDILCFQETITDDLDVLEIDGSEKDEKQI